MNAGRWTPWTRCVWAAADRPAACGSSMSAAALLWATAFSPQGNWAAVPAAQTQALLREWLARWGRPAQMRVDNGTPWGSSDAVPTPLALWLIGLGIGMHWNDP